MVRIVFICDNSALNYFPTELPQSGNGTGSSPDGSLMSFFQPTKLDILHMQLITNSWSMFRLVSPAANKPAKKRDQVYVVINHIVIWQ